MDMALWSIDIDPLPDGFIQELLEQVDGTMAFP
jgi:hypothetical protein